MHSTYLFWYHVHGIILGIKGMTENKTLSLSLGGLQCCGRGKE